MGSIKLRELRDLGFTSELPKLMTKLDIHFCQPMRMLNKCPNDCRVCREHILNIKSRADNWKEPIVNYNAVFAYACREEAADIAESGEVATTPVKDWLGRPVDKTIFEVFLLSIPKGR